MDDPVPFFSHSVPSETIYGSFRDLDIPDMANFPQSNVPVISNNMNEKEKGIINKTCCI